MAITLAQIEQETARRLGPYETHASNANSTQSLFVADDLASSAVPGDKADMWLLRRGVKVDGSGVGGFVAEDRQRLVKLYDPDGTAGNGVVGSLLVDRAWANAPILNEVCELHALDPALELRVAAQKGLDRCYFLDRVQVVLLNYAAERDVTSVLPWLTKPAQLYGAYFIATGSVYAPRPVPWFQPFEQGGHVYLGVSPDPFPFSFLVRALRPVSSLVNNLSAPPTPSPTDIVTGGSLLANTIYNAAIAYTGPYGQSPASVPFTFLTVNDGNNTHVARLAIAQIVGANTYPVYLSTATAPLLVATITEAQRAAGCTITAQNVVSATTPGANLVDVRIAGVGAAAVQATGPTLDADVLNTDLSYAAAAAHVEAWRYFRPKLLQVAAQGMYPGQKEVAEEFTRQAAFHIKPPPDRMALSYPFQAGGILGTSGAWD